MEEVKEKKEPKVLHLVDNWYLGADSYCMILYRQTKITGGNGKKPKEENVGKPNYAAVGYYTTLDSVLTAIVHTHARECVLDPKIKSYEDLCKEMRKFLDRIKKLDETFVAEVCKRAGIHE